MISLLDEIPYVVDIADAGSLSAQESRETIQRCAAERAKVEQTLKAQKEKDDRRRKRALEIQAAKHGPLWLHEVGMQGVLDRVEGADL
jgi:hypothetical protein